MVVISFAAFRIALRFLIAQRSFSSSHFFFLSLGVWKILNRAVDSDRSAVRSVIAGPDRHRPVGGDGGDGLGADGEDAHPAVNGEDGYRRPWDLSRLSGREASLLSFWSLAFFCLVWLR